MNNKQCQFIRFNYRFFSSPKWINYNDVPHWKSFLIWCELCSPLKFHSSYYLNRFVSYFNSITLYIPSSSSSTCCATFPKNEKFIIISPCASFRFYSFLSVNTFALVRYWILNITMKQENTFDSISNCPFMNSWAGVFDCSRVHASNCEILVPYAIHI